MVVGAGNEAFAQNALPADTGTHVVMMVANDVSTDSRVKKEALAGLTLSCGLLAPLGIIFGHIALSQIKRTGENGRGMAIAGLVIGYLSLAGIAIMVISLVASSGSA